MSQKLIAQCVWDAGAGKFYIELWNPKTGKTLETSDHFTNIPDARKRATEKGVSHGAAVTLRKEGPAPC